MLSAVSSTPIAALPEVLFVDSDPVAEKYPMLRDQYRLTLASTASAALHALGRSTPELVVMELDLSDGPAEEVCQARQIARHAVHGAGHHVDRPTECPRRWRQAATGCCSSRSRRIFSYARIGRLLRARSVELRMRAQRQYAKSAHLHERANLIAARTNREWPSTHCPHCNHAGVTSFEHTSHRRSWYACLECKQVWMARRQE